MQLQEDTKSTHLIAPDILLMELMEQYVKQNEQLHHQQQELRKIHKKRPLIDTSGDKRNNEANLVALCYYKDLVFECFREITETEQAIAETLEKIRLYAPNNGKLSILWFKEEVYLIGFTKKYPGKDFVLVKAAKQSGTLTTYLPTRN